MGDFKDKNGKTRVGKFLETLGERAAPVAKAALEVAADLTGIRQLDNVADMIKTNDHLEEHEKEIALELLKLDMIDMQEVTKRWQADMTSDSWLSKNVRPLVLSFLVAFTVIIIIADSVPWGFEVKEMWIDTMTTLSMTAIGAYYGLRSFEKPNFKLPKFRR